MNLSGRTALVTGGAGGIGRAIAASLARRGCHLALVDIDADALVSAERAIARPGLHISRHNLDVADRDAVAPLPREIEAAHGGLDVLVNNAGVALGGTFEETSEEDFDWLLGINFWGVVRMTRAFLPLLRRSDDARLVNLSSVFGLIAPPRQAAYAASKFAVRGFSEALRHELAGSRVGVTTVHPGGVATSIAANAKVPAGADPEDAARRKRAFQANLKLAPEVAGEAIVQAIERRRARVIVGTDAKIAAALERLLPTTHWNFIARLGDRAKADKSKP